MEKEKLARIVVFIVIAGLVGAYIPLLFAPNAPAPQAPAQNDQAASLAPLPTENNKPAPPPEKDGSAPDLKKEEAKSPDGFGGLEDETNSLDELEKQLGK